MNNKEREDALSAAARYLSAECDGIYIHVSDVRPIAQIAVTPDPRALADTLAKGPCERVSRETHIPRCFDSERMRKDRGCACPRRFHKYDPERLCESCRAAWYAEMAAITVGRIARRMVGR